MFINEVCEKTKLTKKALAYYIEQGFLCPCQLENGYRDFSPQDVDCLKKISVFRRLGLSTEQIKVVFADRTGEALRKIAVQKELAAQRERLKKALLHKLAQGGDFVQIDGELRALDKSATITEKLLHTFPGYYGRFICLHFAQFLDEPIVTAQQEGAYAEIVAFLDDAPALDFPAELQAFVIETTKHLGVEEMRQVMAQSKQSIENPDSFLAENKELLEEYMEYKQSEEYKSSPAFKLERALKEFNSSSGYYDVFLPAMERLSASYAEYRKQMETANQKLLEQFPQAASLSQS